MPRKGLRIVETRKIERNIFIRVSNTSALFMDLLGSKSHNYYSSLLLAFVPVECWHTYYNEFLLKRTDPTLDDTEMHESSAH